MPRYPNEEISLDSKTERKRFLVREEEHLMFHVRQSARVSYPKYTGSLNWAGGVRGFGYTAIVLDFKPRL